MEKILLAMNGQHQNPAVVEFSCYIAGITGSRLVGVFLEGCEDGTGTRTELREPTTISDLAADGTPPDGKPVDGTAADGKPVDGTAADKVSQSVTAFREACLHHKVSARIHRDRGVPIQELLDESRFADLVILDPDADLQGNRGLHPMTFIEHFLHAAESAAIVAPYSFSSLESVYFVYDDSESSVYAIKQFTYLFPEMRHKKAVLISVTGNDKDAALRMNKIREWLEPHYPNTEFVILTGGLANDLLAFLLKRSDAIVVMGAYGRNSFSRLLLPSHARLLIKAVNLPLFIAHR